MGSVLAGLLALTLIVGMIYIAAKVAWGVFKVILYVLCAGMIIALIAAL